MLIDKSQDSVYVKLDSIDTSKGVLTAWQSIQPIDDQWDDFLASAPLGHFYQTSMWAQIRTLDGWNPLVILIIIDDHLVGGFQILIRSKSYLGKIGLLLKSPVILSDDLETFFRFMSETCKRQQVLPSPSNIKFLYRMWDLFSIKDNIKLFLAEYEGEIVSCLVVLLLGDTACLWKFGWSEKHPKNHPNIIIYWEIFKWAKANPSSAIKKEER